jgi:hypothetical protein
MQEVLTKIQFQNAIRYTEDIIANLSDKALSELLSGYDSDISKLFNELLIQTNNVINFGSTTLDSEKLLHLTNLESSMDEQLKIISYNYFKTTCLPNFHQGSRNLEWGNQIQLYPKSSYLCQRGSGKCFSPSTEVLMFDGSVKEIKDIHVGDLVMGKDNTPREILELHSGIDDMYEIEQKLSKNYIVNSEHTMYFKKWKCNYSLSKKCMVTDWNSDNAIEISISTKEFFEKSKHYKDDIFGCKIDGWELPEKDLKIEPYWLGLWLGGGNKSNLEIASIDQEIIDYIKNYADRLGMFYGGYTKHSGGTFISHNIAAYKRGDRPRDNKLLKILKDYGLYTNKFIPDIYLQGSKSQRYELLAGLIDSDGSYSKEGKRISYTFTQKDKYLIDQVQKLCWSLGLRANVKEHTGIIDKNMKAGVTSCCMLNISGKIWNIPCKAGRKIANESILSRSLMRVGLDIKYIGKGEYIGFTCDKDHKFILADGTIVNNSYEFCYAFPLWRLYSYSRPTFFIKDTIDNRNRKETMIITNESTLGKNHMSKIVEEIKYNEILREKINPGNKAELNKEGVISEDGAMLKLRTFGSSGIRGNHVGGVVVDDFLDKSALYSKEQRSKFNEVFYAEIISIVEPHGYLIVSGTPFHEKDLYNDLKLDDSFVVFEYPGIFPDGTLLAPDRYTFEHLMVLKKSLGSIVFAREHLVCPVADSSSLFPWEFMEKAFIGMENVSLVENIDSYPFKMKKVVIGCDFAISGSIGADSSVFAVMGVDMSDNYHLIHVKKMHGASHNEQISAIVSLDQRFKPNKIICESNGFQAILADMARQRGLKNIETFTTTAGNKKDLYLGLPSLSAIFERGQFKFPYSEGETRDIINWVCGEFNSISFNEDSGRLESVGEHDDAAMAIFMGTNELRENSNTFHAYLA